MLSDTTCGPKKARGINLSQSFFVQLGTHCHRPSALYIDLYSSRLKLYWQNCTYSKDRGEALCPKLCDWSRKNVFTKFSPLSCPPVFIRNSQAHRRHPLYAPIQFPSNFYTILHKLWIEALSEPKRYTYKVGGGFKLMSTNILLCCCSTCMSSLTLALVTCSR